MSPKRTLLLLRLSSNFGAPCCPPRDCLGGRAHFSWFLNPFWFVCGQGPFLATVTFFSFSPPCAICLEEALPLPPSNRRLCTANKTTSPSSSPARCLRWLSESSEQKLQLLSWDPVTSVACPGGADVTAPSDSPNSFARSTKNQAVCSDGLVTKFFPRHTSISGSRWGARPPAGERSSCQTGVGGSCLAKLSTQVPRVGQQLVLVLEGALLGAPFAPFLHKLSLLAGSYPPQGSPPIIRRLSPSHPRRTERTPCSILGDLVANGVSAMCSYPSKPALVDALCDILQWSPQTTHSP